jgi:hypothetical protein
MPSKKPRPNADRARLDVLAAGDDEAAFVDVALEMLASPQRLAREAALEALVERPLAAARPALRKLYDALDANGSKHDQGCDMRGNIAQILTEIGDTRDVAIAVRACDTTEKVFGDDVAYGLRMRGLHMLARLAPDLLPYYAVEHLDDATRHDDEPAATAIRLLAATGNHAALYQWLRGPGLESPNLFRAFDAFSEAPPDIVRRFVDGAVETAIRRNDETLCTVFAEAIINLEMESTYPALQTMLSAKISDELYSYLAMLLAGTNRPPLLEILEAQLRGGRRPKLVLEALNVRPTDEQRAIVKRWESR